MKRYPLLGEHSAEGTYSGAFFETFNKDDKSEKHFELQMTWTRTVVRNRTCTDRRRQLFSRKTLTMLSILWFQRTRAQHDHNQLCSRRDGVYGLIFHKSEMDRGSDYVFLQTFDS